MLSYISLLDMDILIASNGERKKHIQSCSSNRNWSVPEKHTSRPSTAFQFFTLLLKKTLLSYISYFSWFRSADLKNVNL